MEKYDVFISFRGPDARSKFVCHLSEALKRKEINAYTDSRLERGDEIGSTLLRAIEESKIAVIIFSDDFASSTWCLKEVTHIVKCRERDTFPLATTVIPVFYEVDPSVVRKLLGNYSNAFAMHGLNQTQETVLAWENALKTVANICGIDSRKSCLESELIDEIVQDVLKKVNSMPYPRDDFSKLFGIDERINQLELLLRIGTPVFLVLGIWGMVGIGKTTLATVLYDRVRSHFEGFYFLPDVGKEARARGLSHLRNTLFDSLLGEENNNLGSRSSGSASLKNRLSSRKVLIVLDGVDDADQFNQLLPEEHVQFNPESRVVVTTRSSQLLHTIRANQQYKATELDGPEALQLFKLHAFHTETANAHEYTDLSQKVVQHHSGRVPLALKVLGSYFLPRNGVQEWESALEKLDSVPNQSIHKRMEVCYNELDRSEKAIFLDIACFFVGEDRYFVERVVCGSNSRPSAEIHDLIAKTLITIRHRNKIWMPDLLQKLGREIVLRESENEPGNRSRLWEAKDIRGVLEQNTGSRNIRGIFLDVSNCEGEVTVNPTAFLKMSNLMFLKVYNSRSNVDCRVNLPQDLKSLPNSLTYFHWHCYPLKSLPSNFAPDKLVELGMPYSKLKKLWPTGVRHLGNLKRINLSNSKHLTQIPDLSHAKNVEYINLECCSSLIEIPLYFWDLDNITSLNLRGCLSLRKCLAFPKNIEHLDMKGCDGVETLPSNFSDLQSLWHLNLSGCSKLKKIPEILKPMACLRDLVLDRTPIEELPSSIKYLIGLKVLSLNMCENLQTLPNSISCLLSLRTLSLCRCSKLRSLPELPSSLPCVDARYCTLLETVSSSKLPRNDIHHNSGNFVFYNCLGLDENSRTNIVADAQRRILLSAMTARGDEQNTNHEICFPGDEVPDWFNLRQPEGDEIDIKLDHQDWCNKNWLGFAFCVVVDFWDCRADGDLRLVSQSECIFPSGQTNKWSRNWTWHWKCDDEEQSRRAVNNINTSHVFMFYDYCCKTYWDFPVECESTRGTSITFSFRPEDSYGYVSSRTCQVQQCGVRLIYSDDLWSSVFTCTDVESQIERLDANVASATQIVESRQEDCNSANAATTYHTRSIICDYLCCSYITELFDCIFGTTAVESHSRSSRSVSQSQLMAFENRLQKMDTDIQSLLSQNEQILELLVNQNLSNRVPTIASTSNGSVYMI